MAVIIDGKEFYKGCVADTYEHNGAFDSDFYAIVIVPEEGRMIEVEYDSTRHGGYGYADIDMTLENYQLYLHNCKTRILSELIGKEVKKAKEITKGKEVEVIAGRKVKHGVVGEVFWTKKVNYDKYNRSWYDEVKIGIKDSEGNVYWTYAKNVKVVNYKRYMRPIKEIKKSCNKARSQGYLKRRAY